MAHLVLYRNFRPTTFDEVIGQDHIVKTLTNQVATNSFGHAYLFCGTRGTGKTSCAKIFARAVNCENPVNGNPCGKCPNCISNLNGGNLDIIEIDAASNNRVDEIRDLREKIGYLPSVNKYKVYIVDEVHMLTDSAFNALLKTLEEPPAHAIFILATTEPHKLPATILSRCMRFDFKLVSAEDLIKHLKYVFDNSGIKYDEESLKLIASSGEGSVRDTLSVAEMCAAYSKNNITFEDTVKCLGITDSKTIYEILSLISQNNIGGLIEKFDDLDKNAKDFGSLIKDLTRAFNNLITIKHSQNANELLKLPKDLFSEYEKLAELFASEKLISYLSKLTELELNIRFSQNIKILCQTTLLSLMVENNSLEKLNNRVSELEKKTINESFSLKNENFEINNKIVETIKNNENIIKNDENLQNSTQILEKTELKVENNIENSDKVILGRFSLDLKNSPFRILDAMKKDFKFGKTVGDKYIIEVNKKAIKDIVENKKIFQEIFDKQNLNLSLEFKESEEIETKNVIDFLNEKLEGKIRSK